jgi:DNA-binding IscR family transcriptional regulator
LLQLSTWQYKRRATRFPQKHSPRATACHGILKGIRGPRGGYELARDRKRVTANDILRAAGTVEDAEVSHAGSDLLTKVVLPAMASAEQEFGVALARISLEDLARDAQALKPDAKAAFGN